MQLVVSAPSFLRRVFCLFALLCVVSTLTGGVFAQAPIEVQQMKLVSGETGWLLANGRLFWTSSLGSEWSEITPPAKNGTTSGAFFDVYGNGWALQAAQDGKALTVVRTTDRGQHWSEASVASPFLDGLSYGGAAYPVFTDAQHGWLMLRVASSTNFRPGILLHTTDGGEHWTQLPAPPVGGELMFTDATHGYVGPGPRGDELYSTADGGQTWKEVSLPVSGDLALTPSTITLPAFSSVLNGTLLRTYTLDNGASTTVRYQTTDGVTWKAATALQSSAAAVHALATDGAVVLQTGQSRSLTVAPTPSVTSFSSATQGLVLLRSGSCSESSKVCTQTTTLKGTRDGGKTYFSLGNLPGIEVESTRNVSSQAAGAVAVAPAATASALQSQMGFDKCEIMTTTQMQDWITNSPYRAVGAYVGGISRACTNVGFTASWASTILAQGWGIIPIWVGPQAPNSTLAHKLPDDATAAAAAGVTEADAAVAASAALGFAPGSVIYYDMEAYTRTADSESITRAFVNSWTLELHAKGYLSAIYSSHPEIQDWSPAYIANSPDAIWFAYFFSTGVACGTRCQNTVSSDIPDAYWANHQRLRQTSSSFASTYGSTTASIDEDWTDGPVVITTGPKLTVSLAGTGAGTVTSADTFINCGTVCSAVYSSGTSVTLTATPAALSSFASWSGCASVSGATCTVNVASATNVVATFNVTPPVFTLTSSVSSITWNIGGTAGSNLTLKANAPYQGVFTFACSGLPTFLKCAFSPTTVTADGSGGALTTVLTLTATSAMSKNVPAAMGSARNVVRFALLLPLLGLPFVRRRKVAGLLIAIAVLSLTQMLTGCSDSVKTADKLFQGDVVVTAASAGASQTVTIPVIVQQ